MKTVGKIKLLICFFCLIVSLCLTCCLAPVEAGRGIRDIRLDSGKTSGNGQSISSQISSDGNGHVYVTWEDFRNGRSDIYFNYSEDNGVTWQVKDIKLDTVDKRTSQHPQISSDSTGHVYVVWQDERRVSDSGNYDIYFNYSADYGVTWQNRDIRLDTGDTPGRSDSSEVQISSDGNGHVYVTWQDGRNKGSKYYNSDVYFNYSDDFGVTWQKRDIRLNTGDAPGASNSSAPQISSDGNGHVYVTWGDDRNGGSDIYLNYSADNGVTWQKRDIRLDTGDAPGAHSSGGPQIRSDGNGHVYVVWGDSRNGGSDIYLNYSADNGVTWQINDIRLDTGDTPGANNSREFQLGSDGTGHVYVTWKDFRNGRSSDIYFNYSEDSGVTWQRDAIRLDTGDAPGANNSSRPQISSDSNGHIYVTWHDKRNRQSEDIYFNYSADYGVTWHRNDVRLNTGDAPGANDSYGPQLSNDSNGHVYVTWTDTRNAINNNNSDIYFNYSEDYGVTWKLSDIRIDRDTIPFVLGNANGSQISSDGNGHVYVTWEDHRNAIDNRTHGISNSDIYFNYSDNYGVTWQVNDIRLNTGDAPGANQSWAPQISSDSNGHVYVTWGDDRDGRSDIYFNYSADYGVTWHRNDVRLNTGDAPGANGSYDPQLSSDGNGYVYVTWKDSRNGSPDIYFNYSADNGVTWQRNDVRLDTGDEPGTSDSSEVRICSDDDGHVYVIWRDERNGREDIYFNYSNNYGETWRDSDISLDLPPDAFPQIRSDGNGRIYVTWQDERYGASDIYFNYSEDSGVTWLIKPIRLDTGDTLGVNYSQFPQISSDGNGYVYVVWEDDRNGGSFREDIYFNYSADRGATWQTHDIRLDTGDSPGAHGSHSPQISSDGNGHVFVVWEDRRTRNITDIYFNYSADYGMTWQEDDIRLDTGDAPGANNSSRPQISSDGDGHVYMTWQDSRNAQNRNLNTIYFNYFFVDGVNINDSITFHPIKSTYYVTSDTTDCPDGFVGKFLFDVEIENTSDVALSELVIQVGKLTGGNLLKVAAEEVGGEGATLTIPETGDYSDGVLSPAESIVVPFVICLKELRPFELFVDVLGKQDSQK